MEYFEFKDADVEYLTNVKERILKTYGLNIESISNGLNKFDLFEFFQKINPIMQDENYILGNKETTHDSHEITNWVDMSNVNWCQPGQNNNPLDIKIRRDTNGKLITDGKNLKWDMSAIKISKPKPKEKRSMYFLDTIIEMISLDITTFNILMKDILMDFYVMFIHNKYYFKRHDIKGTNHLDNLGYSTPIKYTDYSFPACYNSLHKVFNTRGNAQLFKFFNESKDISAFGYYRSKKIFDSLKMISKNRERILSLYVADKMTGFTLANILFFHVERFREAKSEEELIELGNILGKIDFSYGRNKMAKLINYYFNLLNYDIARVQEVNEQLPTYIDCFNSYYNDICDSIIWYLFSKADLDNSNNSLINIIECNFISDFKDNENVYESDIDFLFDENKQLKIRNRHKEYDDLFSSQDRVFLDNLELYNININDDPNVFYDELLKNQQLKKEFLGREAFDVHYNIFMDKLKTQPLKIDKDVRINSPKYYEKNIGIYARLHRNIMRGIWREKNTSNRSPK